MLLGGTKAGGEGETVAEQSHRCREGVNPQVCSSLFINCRLLPPFLFVLLSKKIYILNDILGFRACYTMAIENKTSLISSQKYTKRVN